jgi:hypothetical protein
VVYSALAYPASSLFGRRPGSRMETLPDLALLRPS